MQETALFCKSHLWSTSPSWLSAYGKSVRHRVLTSDFLSLLAHKEVTVWSDLGATVLHNDCSFLFLPSHVFEGSKDASVWQGLAIPQMWIFLLSSKDLNPMTWSYSFVPSLGQRHYSPLALPLWH